MSKDFVPYLNITARVPGKPEDDMLGKKGGRGFPHCIIMDETGKVLKQARPSAEAPFKAAMRPVSILMDARKAVAEKATKEAKLNLALIEAVMDPTEKTLKKLAKSAKKKSVDEEIQKLFMATVKEWPVRQVVQEAEKAQDRRAAEKESGKKMYELLKKKVVIDNMDSDYFVPFWFGIANHATEIKDKKVGLAALDQLEKKFKDNSRAMNHFKGMRAKFEAM